MFYSRFLTGFATLIALLLATTACLETPSDLEPERLDYLDAPEEREHGPGLDIDRLDPVLIVDLSDVDATRSLFHLGEAHFESSEPFRQISWMMDAEDSTHLEYSALLENGQWSPWKPVAITFSEGIFHNALIALEDPTHQLKLRGGESIHSARLEFFEEILANPEVLSGEPLLQDREEPSLQEEELRTSIQAVAPSSLVVSRSQWGAVNPNKLCGSVVTPYRMAIHHTAVPSNDGGEPAARMRQMQSYHMNNLGWCDIGYHFVVSQSGLIFQGRSRSNRPGTHVRNQNHGNVGISFIANFSAQTPTNTQLNAGADIIRWVHQTYAIALNRDRVLGHREHSGQSTTCPGDHMIPMIAELLRRASNASNPSPDPEPAPAPDPGGCVPTEDDNAQNSFFKDFRVTATGYDDAVRLFNAGITQGCSSSPRMFCPNCPTTRLQIATFLARAANLNTSNPPAQATFADVPVGSRGFEFVEAIAAAGITTGCGNGNFCPNDPITRAQIATMIHRAMGWPHEIAAEAPSFADVPSGHAHYAAIETLKQRCVTNGCDGGTNFCPDDSVSRAHAAAFIARAFNLEGSNPCAAPGGCQPSEAFGTEDSLFADFPIENTGYQEATLLYEEGITTGCTSSPSLMFCPRCPINRRQLMIFVVRAADLDTSNPPTEPTFADVLPDSTGYAEIEAAVAAGLTTGCGNGNFCPGRQITRAETATMIARARGWEPEDPATSSFSDVSLDSAHFAGIESLADRCVTQGCRPDQFCPTGNVTRAHAALFIARAFNLGEINPCAEAPGTSPGSGGSFTEPTDDLDDDSDELPTPGTGCDDVDPAFQTDACTDEDPLLPDAGQSDEDQTSTTSVQRGCTALPTEPQGPFPMLLLLAIFASFRLRDRRR